MKYHYTYKITQPSTRFYYIGVRSCTCNPINDPYMGSMHSWKLTKDEKALCIKEIIAQYDTREEANDDERFMISQIKLDWKDTNCMNKHIPGKGYCVLGIKRGPMPEEHRAKISATCKGKPKSEETRAKMSTSKKGEKNKMYGKPKSEETRAKMSAAGKGKIFSDEHKANLSAARKRRYI